MRPALVAVLVLAAAVLGAGAGWLARTTTTRPPPPPVATAAERPARIALDSLDGRIRRVRARFERVRPPLSREENALRRPRTPMYREHLRAADSLGVPPVGGEADLRRHVAAGRLVPLADTEGYTVRILEHSAPFVTPDAAALLGEIGRRFQARLDAAGLPRYRLTVSSATRTADFQADLRRTNRNATGGTSSHEYGVSFDLVYWRFAYAPQPADSLAFLSDTPLREPLERLRHERLAALGALYWDRLFGELTRVLREIQEEGKALVLLEAEQPVFHVTVARRY